MRKIILTIMFAIRHLPYFNFHRGYYKHNSDNYFFQNHYGRVEFNVIPPSTGRYSLWNKLHLRFSHFITHNYFDLRCPKTELRTAEKSRTAYLVASLRLERKSKVYETLILPLDQLAIKEFYHITWITLNQAHLIT